MTKAKIRLPLTARILLKWLLPGHDAEGVYRLHEEGYREKRINKGRISADTWLLFQIMRALPALLKLNIQGDLMMLRNYFKIALRTLFKHKVYSFINVAGLAMGIACCLLIFLWVIDEMSYDRFHDDLDRIQRVVFDQDYSGKLFRVMVTPYPLAAALREEIPDVVGTTRVGYLSEVLIRRQEKKLAFYESGIHAVDQDFFKVFTFPLIKGREQTVFQNPHSLVLSASAADKYFPGEDPLGQILTLYDRSEFIVTGVLKDVPANSSLQFDFLIPYSVLESSGNISDDWESNNVPTYIKLREGVSPIDVNTQIASIFARHIDTSDLIFSLLPMSRLHFQTRSGFNTVKGISQSLMVISGVALLVLLIACINFMNLATARSAVRAKEVGVRKVVGAKRSDIIKQFYGESFLFTFISFLIAMGLVILFLPVFNSLTGKSISLDLIRQGYVFLGLLGMTAVTGFLAGSYPSLILSRFQPVKVFRKRSQTGTQRSVFRRILVVFQFAASISLIIGTGIVYDQLAFMRQKNLGFDREHVIYMQSRADDLDVFNSLKSEWEKYPGIQSVSSAEHKPSAIYSNTNGVNWTGKDPEESVSMYFTRVNYDYFKTAGIEFLEGRPFSRQYSTDAEQAYIVNEEALKVMGKTSAVNIPFTQWDNPGTIIGVVKDFHFNSLQAKIEPLVIRLRPRLNEFYLVRIQPGDISSTLNNLERGWEKVLPGYPFEFRFMNDDFERLYRAEMQMGALLKYFSAFAIFIACLGLFGLVTFSIEQRTKEFGVRKVLGASAPHVVSLICREFVFLLGISILLSWPVVFLLMRGWLGSFAYRTTLNPITFLVSALLSFGVASLTIGFQAIKTSTSNPIKALRYE
ncbi:ABC transporter permease [Acidobacteriota bacterium]